MANAITAAHVIRSRMAAAGGPLPWSEVMRMALYEPGVGYYRRGVTPVGRSGDFYTSVSVGPVFGELLAIFVAQVWRALGEPPEFAVIEQGAHDGALIRDIFVALEKKSHALFEAARCVVVEPDPVLRAAQRQTLARWSDKLTHADDWAALAEAPEQALFLCNELLDAMPVQRVQFTAAGWREMQVQATDAGGFEFFPSKIPSGKLDRELARLGVDFPVGYTTEINVPMLDWVRSAASARFRGAMLVLDYGMSAAEYFSPERVDGTLRRYRQHQCDGRVLEDLGECDLTAHVNFTRLAQEALTLDLPTAQFIEQGRFLTQQFQAGMTERPWEPDAAWLRQFQSLTHPGIMGRSFQALVLAKGMDATRFASPEMQAAASRRLGL